jgi:hypothetical protein
MGHSEMQLAVAGLDKQALDERTIRLAGGDWSHFPAAERAAFFFARKQAKSPWEMTDDDLRVLIAHLGVERAIDVVFWASRSHYMTRVADGFQLPLERENVFQRKGPRAQQGKLKARP